MMALLTRDASTPEIAPTKSARIAVWGSAGSGKTLVAINLAFELARLGNRVLLIDLDLTRPSIASWLGITDAGPGITAALRLAKTSRLDVDQLMRLCAELKFGGSKLEVLTGLSNPNRWSEVTPEAIELLESEMEGHFDFIVFDLNDAIDGNVPSQILPPSRQETTRRIAERADLLLATFSAEPVGINRFLFDLHKIDRDLMLIANRVGTKSFGKSSTHQLAETIGHFTPMKIRAALPNDPSSCEASICNARPLMLESPNAKLTIAVRTLACEIVDDWAARINSERGET